MTRRARTRCEVRYEDVARGRACCRAGLNGLAGRSVRPDHGYGRLCTRWADRHPRAHHHRADAGIARPTAHHRERAGRHWNDCHRPRRARGAGRPHAQHGQLDHPCRRPRDLSDCIRRVERSRTGVAAADCTAADNGKEDFSAQQHPRIDCVAQSQSGPGNRRDRRVRQLRSCQSHRFRTENRDPLSVRALSRRRPGDERLGLRASRRETDRGINGAAASAQRQDQSLCRSCQDPLGRRAGHSHDR